jgi:hypothetical protein
MPQSWPAVDLIFPVSEFAHRPQRLASAFNYRSLKQKAIEIRLVRIYPPLPGSYRGERSLACELRYFCLDIAPPYKALSYTWGRRSSRSSITVNGRPWKVLENLSCFLRRAQLEFRCSGWFWIDAMCKNQEDVEERNHQVLKMRQIYEGAQKIVIWLGDWPYLNDERVGEAIVYLANLDFDQAELTTAIDDPASPLCRRETWESLEYMLHLSYWERVWVIQEATTPEKSPTEVWCGRKVTLWSNLMKANRVLYEAMLRVSLQRFQSIYSSRISELSSWTSGRRDPGEYGPLKVMEFLPAFRYRQATDARDIIYAVLSISVDGQHEDLQPDYSLTVAAVYRNLAIHLISRDRTLGVLSFCNLGFLSKTPSWAPDWTKQQTPFSFEQAASIGVTDPQYRAGNQTKANFRLSKDNRVLHLQGVLFDQVSHVAKAKTPSVHDIRQLIPEWAYLTVPGDAEYVAGGARFDALQHCLCAHVADDDGEYAFSTSWPILINKKGW